MTNRLEEIEQRIMSCSPHQPWQCFGCGALVVTMPEAPGTCRKCGTDSRTLRCGVAREDADWLLAEVRRLRELLRECRDELQVYREDVSEYEAPENVPALDDLLKRIEQEDAG